jgi:hypothetical protein
MPLGKFKNPISTLVKDKTIDGIYKKQKGLNIWKKHKKEIPIEVSKNWLRFGRLLLLPKNI